MKIENYHFPKSSFLSIEKDYALIIDKILKNERLKKLLYYTTKDALERENLNQEQTLELLENNIIITPQIIHDEKIKNYIVIDFDHFFPNENNPEFRDNQIIFDVVCHADQWNLKDFQLRPFKIAGEIDSMFNEARLTGIGKLQFVTAGQLPRLDENWYGICLIYQAIHSEEDKKEMLNPADWQDFIEDFDETYND